MFQKIILTILLALTLIACQPAGEQINPIYTEPNGESVGGIQIPEPVEGKFNVAFVYVGPIGDGGWTYAHNQGRLYLENALGDAIHTAYLESVPEGADAERVIRNLARAGFDAIFSTSFGFMDSTATVAEEFPDVDFVHVSGYRSNDTNLASLFGGMESIKYLAGIIAGAAAQDNGYNRLGYIAPYPIAEVIRHMNAFAIGMRESCPDCVMDVRWIFTWFDPAIERQAAESLIESGAKIIITGADTSGPVQAAGERGLLGIGYDSENACEIDPQHCLTVPYWNWGPQYVALVNDMMNGSFNGQDIYFDVDSGALGLYGFMPNQIVQPAVPLDIIPSVTAMLNLMQNGQMNRFDIFTGPIYNNRGELIVPDGITLTQSDLEGIDESTAALTGREVCTYCMNWLVEGIDPAVTIE